MPPEEAECELALTVTNGADNWMDTSIATDTAWQFRTKRTDDARTVLPLVQANYELRTGLHNEVATGESYPLTVLPEYQPEARGPGGFTGTVEVSFDDGQTWTSLEVERVDGKLKATVPAPAKPGFALSLGRYDRIRPSVRAAERMSAGLRWVYPMTSASDCGWVSA